MTVTKKEIVERVVEKTELPRDFVRDAVDCMFKVMADMLTRGERIEIRGIGSWTVKEVPARIARDPRTGKPVKVKPRKKIRFKMGQTLNKLLNG